MKPLPLSLLLSLALLRNLTSLPPLDLEFRDEEVRGKVFMMMGRGERSYVAFFIAL